MRFFEGKPALEYGLSGHENSVERAGRDFALPAPIKVAGGQAHMLSALHLIFTSLSFMLEGVIWEPCLGGESKSEAVFDCHFAHLKLRMLQA